MQKTIVDATLFSRILDRVAHEIIEKHTDTSKLCLVGIKTRGVYLAQRLHERIVKFADINLPMGELT
jgi:pyrimidine operon attenuation protein/uracil phosphoribosyltransferase